MSNHKCQNAHKRKSYRRIMESKRKWKYWKDGRGERERKRRKKEKERRRRKKEKTHLE